MQVPIVEERVNLIYPMGDYFSLQVGQEICEADAVILATGVNFGKPLPGEEEFLGRGVSYCATCDAPLYRGATVAVIAYQKSEEAEADFLADIAEKVYYFPMYKEPVEVSEKDYGSEGSSKGDYRRHEGGYAGDKGEQLSGGLVSSF